MFAQPFQYSILSKPRGRLFENRMLGFRLLDSRCIQSTYIYVYTIMDLNEQLSRAIPLDSQFPTIRDSRLSALRWGRRNYIKNLFAISDDH
jgi:hypothetical protein